MAGIYDYGHYGALLKENIKNIFINKANKIYKINSKFFIKY
jgi:glycyl-tRNA synthetase (class II)